MNHNYAEEQGRMKSDLRQIAELSVNLRMVFAYDDARQIILKLMHSAPNDNSYQMLQRILQRMNMRPLRPRCLS
jgi:hypothetical protein